MIKIYYALCVLAAELVVTLAFSYLPGIWLASFVAGLRLHLSAVLIVLALFCLCLHRGPSAFVFLVLGGLFLAHCIYLTKEYAHPVNEVGSGTEKSLRFISFNILGVNERGADIADMIEKSGADLVFTMESHPLKQHLTELEKIYPYQVGCGEQTKHCSSMIFSKMPLKNVGVYSLGNLYRERLVTADIEFSGRKIHLASIHLSKPYFDFLHESEIWQAYRRLKDKTGPMLMAGDFNSAILARDMRDFLGSLDLKTAPDEPNTWPVKGTALGVPIDHILTRQPLGIKSIRRLDEAYGSNHFGLIAELVFDGAE